MERDYGVYTSICWLFAAAFGLVLVGLTVWPTGVAKLVGWSGGIFGLSGEVTIGANDLDHILSLSLMACIFVLAVSTARNPASVETFAALMVAKVVSTLGFAYLAVGGASVWLVPALTDGFVAVLLAVTRIWGRVEAAAREPTG